MAPKKNLIAIDGSMDSVSSLRVRVAEKGRRADPYELRITRADAVHEFVRCSNPLCQEGGFSLGELLREMIRDRRTEFLGVSYCIGQEGDLEIPESLKSCQTRFEVEATLSYRS